MFGLKDTNTEILNRFVYTHPYFPNRFKESGGRLSGGLKDTDTEILNRFVAREPLFVNERKINIGVGSCSVFSAADDPESERRRCQSTVVINYLIFNLCLKSLRNVCLL